MSAKKQRKNIHSSNRSSPANKAVKLDDETHKQLSIYKAKNEIPTLGEAVKELLNKAYLLKKV